VWGQSKRTLQSSARHSCALNKSPYVYVRWQMKSRKKGCELKLRWTHFSASKNNVRLCKILTSYSILKRTTDFFFFYHTLNLQTLRKTRDATKTNLHHALYEPLWHWRHYTWWGATNSSVAMRPCYKMAPLPLSLFFILQIRYENADWTERVMVIHLRIPWQTCISRQFY
jgi:hypothetical protein